MTTALADTEAHVLSFYSAMLTKGADPHVVAAALALELAAEPRLVETFDCHGPGCDNATATPVRDEQQVFWLGENAQTFCSNDCLTNAAEAYWMGRAA